MTMAAGVPGPARAPLLTATSAYSSGPDAMADDDIAAVTRYATPAAGIRNDLRSMRQPPGRSGHVGPARRPSTWAQHVGPSRGPNTWAHHVGPSGRPIT